MDHSSPAFHSELSGAHEPEPIEVHPILKDPRFKALVRERRFFSWSLTAIMLIVYFSFILTLAFSPSLLGRPIVEGQPATWGIPVGFGMFVITFVLVAIYVFRANTVYDPAIGDIKQGVGK